MVPTVTVEWYGRDMGHIIELVVEWAVFGGIIAAVAAAAGLLIRAVGSRKWTTIAIAEGAFAIGAVLGFVALVMFEVAF